MFKSVVRGLPSERWHKAAKSSALFSCSSVGFWFHLTMVQRESDCTCDGIITCSFIKDGPVYPIIKGDQKGSNEAPFLYTWRCGYLDTSRSFHSVGNLPKKTRMTTLWLYASTHTSQLAVYILSRLICSD